MRGSQAGVYFKMSVALKLINTHP
ncbi:hypothetical protein BREVUG8_100239 [Brevundimonas sp. G8]|nr:hypothetical protein BREVUG8_100239 [Brevundimonas sp. G8]